MNNNISSDKYYKKYLKYKKKYLDFKKSYGGAAADEDDDFGPPPLPLGQADDDFGPPPLPLGQADDDFGPPPPPMRARTDEDITQFSDFKDVKNQVLSNEDLKRAWDEEDRINSMIFEMDGNYVNNLINAASGQLDAASGQLEIDAASGQLEIDAASDQLEIDIEDLKKLKDKSKNSTVESNFDSILVEKEKQIAELTKKIQDLRIQAAHKILFPLSYTIIEKIKEKIRKIEDWNFDRDVLTRSCKYNNYTSQVRHLVTHGTKSCIIKTILTPLFDELAILNAEIIRTGKFYGYKDQTSIVKAKGVQDDINKKRSKDKELLELLAIEGNNHGFSTYGASTTGEFIGGNNNPNK